MAKKYPGGYTIIDLGGITIPADGTAVRIERDIFLGLTKSQKPLYITNFNCPGMTGLANDSKSCVPCVGNGVAKNGDLAIVFGFANVDSADGHLEVNSAIMISENNDVTYWEL